MVRIYLDVCCLNRPFDDQSQERIRLEAEAVVLILARVHAGNLEWVSSEVVDHEISLTPDRGRRTRVATIARTSTRRIALGEAEERRGLQLEALGFRAMDALHVACAESGGADAFLTTDDKLVGLAARHKDKIRLVVRNPLNWLLEG